MGIRKSLLIIEGEPSCTTSELIGSFGFRHIKQKENAKLGEYIYPNEGSLAISYNQNFTIIAHDTLPLSLLNSDSSRRRYFFDMTIRRYYKVQNYLALMLDSSFNFYAMRLERNEKDYFIWGSANSQVVWKEGDMTDIELEYLKKSDVTAVDSWGRGSFTIDGETYTHDQIGENIVLWNIRDFTQIEPSELYNLDAEVFSVRDEHLAYHP